MSIQVLLKDKVKEIMNNYPDVSKSGKNVFEIAVVSMLNLKYLSGIDHDDLLNGIVGRGGDEGIDACYLFVNEELVRNTVPTINKSALVRLEIIQAKNHDGFSTNAFGNTCDGVEEIFTLEIRKFKYIGANDDLVQKA